MFYIYSQMNLHGTAKRDKDYLLLLSTLEAMDIKFQHLPEDISNYQFTKNDIIFLSVGSMNIDLFLKNKNLKNTNVYPSIETCSIYNKDKFNIFCEENNLPIPKTFYSLEQVDHTDFPLLFKPVSGSLSEYLKICNTKEDVLHQINLLNNDVYYNNKNYILQEFIDTGKPVTKYRTIYAGDITLTYKAIAQQDTSFVTLGEHGIVNEIEPDNIAINEISQRFKTIAQEKNIDFGALDILQDLHGNCYFLELNAPTKLYRGSQGIGKNIYEIILKYILTNYLNKV